MQKFASVRQKLPKRKRVNPSFFMSTNKFTQQILCQPCWPGRSTGQILPGQCEHMFVIINPTIPIINFYGIVTSYYTI